MSTCEMPGWVDQRHHELHEKARELYGLRNAAEHYGDLDRARDYHELGDEYFYAALALSAEWEEA
jgi:hypothetical protein